MDWTGYAVRRARSRAGLLTASFALVAVATAGVVGIAGTAASRIADATAEVLAAAPPTGAAVRLESRLAADPAAQTARVDESLDAALSAAPVDVFRSLRAAAVPALVGTRGAAVVLGSEPDLADRAELAAGDWPSAPLDVAPSAAAAALLGVEPGDTLVVGGTELTVSGTWTPLDPADPAWFSDPAVASGALGSAAGPLLLDEATLAGLDDVAVRVRWTVVPRVDALGAAELAVLTDAVARLEAETIRIRADSPDPVNLEGALATTLGRASRVAATVSGVVAVPLVLLIVLAGVVLGLIGRALAASRSGEEVLLRGRGRSRAAAWGLAAAEAALVGVAGAGVGLASTVPFGLSVADVWPIAAALALAAALVLTIVVSLSRPLATRADDTGRGALVASLGMLVLAVIAAGIAVVQLAVTGPPVSANPDGGVRVDPLGLAAPALLLLAAGLLARLIATPVLALVERAAARSRGLLPVLPARQLARRTRTVAAAFLVIALGAGAATYAAIFDGSAVGADTATARTATGGDVRVRLLPASDDEVVPGSDPTALYDGIAGVTAAVPLALVDASVGRDRVPLLVADVTALPDLDRVFRPLAALAPQLTDSDEALPIVVTSGVAARLGVHPGDGFTLIVPSVTDPVDVRIVAVEPTLPGAGGFGILADPGALSAIAERDGGTAPEVNEIWLATTDPAATVAAARAVTSRPAEFTTRASASSAAPLAVGIALSWVGALACLALAIVGFGAVAAALHRDRRGEVMPLRSLGFGARAQARSRAIELTLTGAAALVLGIGAGWLAAAITVPGLVGGLAIAVTPWLVVLGLLALGLVVVGAVASLSVRREVAKGEVR